MKIIKFTAENVKRLRAVEITPDGTVQVVTGRNAQGKTSVLDAIWLALGGGPASKSTIRPIRDGEDRANVRLDLGDLVVTRTWVGDKTTLKVESADGAKYSSPQGVLDSLVGRLSFDPLEFTRLNPREQVAALLDLVDLDVDLDSLARQRQAAYDARAEIGRQGKAIGDIPNEIPGVPDAEVSASDLIAQIRDAETLALAQFTEVEAASIAAAKVKEIRDELANWETTLKGRKAKVAAHTSVPDVTALESDLKAVEETNRAVRQNVQVKQAKARKAALLVDYQAQTAAIDAIDATKAAALAGANFPVPDLGFDDDGVTYQGVPFSQASSAEQIKVSLAMAMSLNPKLRVIRILDGSLLDPDNMELIAKMATEADYQVWIERVSDDTGVGVVIEDGQVAS